MPCPSLNPSTHCARVLRSCMPVLAEEGEEQLAEEAADVEAHRSVERKLGIDHNRQVLSDHD